MTPAAMLAELAAQGVAVTVAAGDLKLRSRHPLGPDLVAALRLHKPAILALLTTAHTSDTGPVDNFATAHTSGESLPDLLRRYGFRQHPAGHRLSEEEQDAYIHADLDAVCDCGRPASHLTEHGAWQCPRCAGQGEPSLPLSEAERGYDALRWELHQARGAQGRARRAGDHAAADALEAYGDRLSHDYAAMRQKGL
jgi:hypothetical protein